MSQLGRFNDTDRETIQAINLVNIRTQMFLMNLFFQHEQWGYVSDLTDSRGQQNVLGTQQMSKYCSHIDFPNTGLVRMVRLPSGKFPHRVASICNLPVRTQKIQLPRTNTMQIFLGIGH